MSDWRVAPDYEYDIDLAPSRLAWFSFGVAVGAALAALIMVWPI